MHNKLEYKPIEQTGGKTPGPGTYEFHVKNKKTAPAFRQGSEKRAFGITNKTVLGVPGANTYKPNLTFTQSSGSKWVFGSEVRKGPVDSKQNSPGPGNYALEPIAFDSKRPRFYVGQKIKAPKETTVVPGAGSYNPSPENIKKKEPSYLMGAKLGSSLITNNKVPGPGNYEAHLKDKKDAPKYGFGSSTRDEKLKLNVPGPGSYRINSSIGDVPAYAMPNRSDEYKLSLIHI